MMIGAKINRSGGVVPTEAMVGTEVG